MHALKTVMSVHLRSASQPVLFGCMQNIDGDGRWKIEWYGVPCNVGDGKLQYSFVMKDYYFFEFVVSNTRIPINGVSVYINGKWLDLAHTHTNTWAYYRVRARLSLLILSVNQCPHIPETLWMSH